MQKDSSFLITIAFLIAGAISSLPSLLTWQLFNLWLKELGHGAAFISSLSIVGIPHYFKSILAPYLERWQPHKLHSNCWLNWMIYSALASALIASLLGNLLPQMNYASLGICGLMLNLSGIIFEKSSYFFKLISLPDHHRANAIWGSKMGYRVGHSLGEVLGLCLAHYYNWSLVYHIYSILFLMLGSFLLIQGRNSYPIDARKISIKSPLEYIDLAGAHKAFLAACFLVGLGDHLTGLFLTVYLKEIGLSYIRIAIMGKAWGLICFFIGATIGRFIWTRHRNTLLFWAMLACLLHGIALLPLMYAEELRSYLSVIFLFKNITLGLKNVLITAVISEYLASSEQPVGLYLLASISRSCKVLVTSASGPIMAYSPRLLFMLAGLAAIPAAISLQVLANQRQSKSCESLRSSEKDRSSISSMR